MIFSLVAMIGLEKCCLTSACLQWLCHSGERIVARGPLVPYFSATSLSRHMAACTALKWGAQCSMPVRLGHWQSQTSNICSRMTGQWSDISAMSGCSTLSHCPMSYLPGLALRIWTSFWWREGSAGMDTWNAPVVQSRQPVAYSFGLGLGGARWHGSSWQRGIAESETSRLSTVIIDTPGDLV